MERAFGPSSSFGNTSVTSAYSVKFPFWQSIISNQEQSADALGNTPPYFLRVISGRVLTLPVRFEKDAIFKMLYAKFNALDNRDAIDQFVSRTNGRSLLDTNGTDFNNLQGYGGAIQNMDFIRISMALESIGGRIIENQLPLQTMQGEQSGMCQLRMEALNPQSSSITLKIENKAPWDIFVNGVIFGYKFRIGGE